MSTSQAEPPAYHWIKSSLSFANGNCVEAAELPRGGMAVRNSRDPDGPVLEFTPDEWDAFLGGVRNGEFDRFGGTVQGPPVQAHDYDEEGDCRNCGSDLLAGSGDEAGLPS